MIKPKVWFKNIPTPTEPMIKSGPEVEAKAFIRTTSSVVSLLFSYRSLVIFAPTG